MSTKNNNKAIRGTGYFASKDPASFLGSGHVARNADYATKGVEVVKTLPTVYKIAKLGTATVTVGTLGLAATGLGIIAGWAIDWCHKYITRSDVEENVKTIKDNSKELGRTFGEVRQTYCEVEAAHLAVSHEHRRLDLRNLQEAIAVGLWFEATYYPAYKALDRGTRVLDKVGAAVETLFANINELRNSLIDLQKERDLVSLRLQKWHPDTESKTMKAFERYRSLYGDEDARKMLDQVARSAGAYPSTVRGTYSRMRNRLRGARSTTRRP